MTTPSKNDLQEHTTPSPIFGADPFLELMRQLTRNQLMSHIMPPLAGLEKETIAALKTVLDLGCGPGTWVMDVAFAYPHITAAGIDGSQDMVNYANTTARTRKLTNASFGVMDLLHPLDVSNECLDLVNLRFLGDRLPRTAWEPLLAECFRLLKPGGVVRIIDHDRVPSSTSAALTHLEEWLLQAMHGAGLGLVDDGAFVITPHVMGLLETAGFTTEILCEPFILDASANSPLWPEYFRLVEITFDQVKPAILAAELASQADYERELRQAKMDLYDHEFRGQLSGLLVWARKPE
jgi:SAM-dependent methyltransferase